MYCRKYIVAKYGLILAGLHVIIINNIKFGSSILTVLRDRLKLKMKELNNDINGDSCKEYSKH